MKKFKRALPSVYIDGEENTESGSATLELELKGE